MSLTITPVSMTDILNLQAGIEGFTNAAEATAEVALINAGTDTVQGYATKLEAANTATSEAVMATVSLMEGGTPTAGKLLSPTSTANEFQHLIVDYLPTQQAFAVANKLNITLYNAEVIGLGIGAGGDGTQNNFLKNFGSPTLTVAQFETTLSGLTNVSVAAIDAQYQFFVKLYGGAPANLPAGYPNADAAARATTFGFAVGTDLANPTLNPTLISQIENAKVLNAETINGDVSGAAGYQNNVALGSQPIAPPLQGFSELEIQANAGALLGMGVDIKNIQVVEHIGATTGDLTVDMSLSGSANELDLAATYAGNNVSVSNLTNAQTVLYEGLTLNNLTLAHATGGLANVINFTMAADAEVPQPGNLTLTTLTVGPGLAAVNINSAGTAPDNVITNANAVQDNVVITGGTHLTFGSAGGPYSFQGGPLFLGGTIDASADTGGVQTWLARLSVSGPNQQTFIGGPGNDLVHLLNFTGDVINFTTGGSDIVDFHELLNDDGSNLLSNPTSKSNSILGFTQANDTINITNGLPMNFVHFTNNGAVPPGAATNILQYTTGAVVDASALADNWIKIDTPTSEAGQTAREGFTSAMGGGSITVATPGASYILSYYDLADSQAVFVTANTIASTIDGSFKNTSVSVIGVIHMSQADYAALTAANLTFLHV